MQKSENKKNSEDEIFHFVPTHHLDHYGTSYYEHMYIDICDGDLIAGILLARIIYWFSPDCRFGKTRTTQKYNGKLCIIRIAEDWWKECRISKKRYLRSIVLLEKKEFISTEIHFNPQAPKVYQHATYIFLNKEKILEAISKLSERKLSHSYLHSEILPPKIPICNLEKLTESDFKKLKNEWN